MYGKSSSSSKVCLYSKWSEDRFVVVQHSVKLYVLTECFSRRILRLRTTAIDLIHSERVSTLTSSFFAHRLAYSSSCQSSGAMNMRQVPCISGPCSKDLSVLYYVLYWDHLSLYGLMERTEILNQSSCKVGDHGKNLESRVAANLLCNWRFWKQQKGYCYRKCMANLCIESTEGFYLRQTSGSNCC